MQGKRILLIVGGGVAAYKSLLLVRLLRKAGVQVTPLLTAGGAKFVTPLSLSSLCESKVYENLWSLTDEAEMGHIELSRSADLIVVAPATADLMAKATAGICDDLATTTLLATDKRVLMAPAMNVRMWDHPATQQNLATLTARGVLFVGPNEGEMACGEYGPGRMAEPEEILAAIETALAGDTLIPSPERAPRPTPTAMAEPPPLPPQVLAGRRALVTAGPTVEPIDPVRVLTNRSSGRQGYAIAAALRRLGAEVTLVSGPTELQAPHGVDRISVETAQQMLDACRAALPADIAVLVAAVADWRPQSAAGTKIKKGGGTPTLALTENPDILATLSKPGPARPALVIGFAAETNDVEANARAKLVKKGCDLIVANDVSGGAVVGKDENTVVLVAAEGSETWPSMSKQDVADRLVERIAGAFE